MTLALVTDECVMLEAHRHLSTRKLAYYFAASAAVAYAAARDESDAEVSAFLQSCAESNWFAAFQLLGAST